MTNLKDLPLQLKRPLPRTSLTLLPLKKKVRFAIIFFPPMILQKAIAFAKHHHNNQKRITSEDYFQHPLRVMKQLENLGMPKSILCAAVLHDVCEETEASTPDIIKEFGDEVGMMVHFLSKKAKNGSEERNTRLQTYIDQLKQGGLRHPGVILIKMNDQIDNIRTFFVFSLEKRKRKIQEIKKVFLPFYETQSQNIPSDFRQAFNVLYQELIQAIQKEEFSILEKVAKNGTQGSQQVILRVMSHLLCLMDSMENNRCIHTAYQQVMLRLEELESKTVESKVVKNH